MSKLSVSRLVFSLSFASTIALALEPPEGSWESWLQTLHKKPTHLKSRPDGLKIDAPLPLWVDCHLSWGFDTNQPWTQNNPHLKRLTLQSTPKRCDGQAESWVNSKRP